MERCELLKLEEGEMKWRRKGQVRGKKKKISVESTRGEVSTSNTLLLRLGKFEEMFVGAGKKKMR